MKRHISSRLFTKLDNFLPFVSKNENYIFQSLNYVDMNLMPRFLIKNGFYIVPSPSTAFEFNKTDKSFSFQGCEKYFLCDKVVSFFAPKNIFCFESLLLSEKQTQNQRKALFKKSIKNMRGEIPTQLKNDSIDPLKDQMIFHP